jgi:serine/threonine-protein kinase ATR
MTRTDVILALGFLVLTKPQAAAAWDATAGAIAPHTDSATFSATSDADDDELDNVHDGDETTFWQSGGCLPYGYIGRSELNLILDACDAGLCTSSNEDGDPSEVVDNDVYTGYSTGIDDDGVAWFEVALPTEQTIERVSMKASVPEDIEVTVTTASGDEVLGTYTAKDAYSWVAFDGPTDPVTSVRVESSSSFSLSELAVLGEACFEQVNMDFGETVEIGLVRSRHYSGTATATTLLASDDGETWEAVAELVTDATATVSTRIDPPIEARYFALRHDTEQEDYEKVYLWEIGVWDADGIYGPRPDPVPGTATLEALMGVNGIWGWGTGDYSTSDSETGPDLYAQVASTARNYHNMHWDVNDPDTVPDYEAMAAGGGTDAQWWLNWDTEYQVWQDSGMSVQTSIQFTTDYQPESSWDDPYEAAYAYGEAFAAHFGPTVGNGLVSALEVGNEPYKYEASFYREVLSGMAAGVKAGDPEMQVMPSSMSATGLVVEDEDGGWDLGTRVTEEHADLIDAINTHVYSFYYEADGMRTMVHPEHRDSLFQEVQNVVAWRDANMPDTPVYVTEWGWPSDGGGEECTGDAYGDECVSEHAQALYAVRGLMMLARWGVERSHWFFYANLTSGSHLFERCGLTGSADTNFEPKQSFDALLRVRQKLGDRVFVDVLQENDEAYVYVFGKADSTPTHVVAWLPVDADSEETGEVTLALDTAPLSAWTLSGLEDEGETVDLPTETDDGWVVAISPVPVVLALVEGEDEGESDSGGGDTGTAEDDETGPGSGGCGCRSAPGPDAWWLPLLAFLSIYAFGHRRTEFVEHVKD